MRTVWAGLTLVRCISVQMVKDVSHGFSVKIILFINEFYVGCAYFDRIYLHISHISI